jgi:ferredoxin-NADP reductase
MAGTAVLVRSGWRNALVVAANPETTRARTLRLHISEFGATRAGQHVDVRLTAEDGYQASRSYSIASAPAEDELEITVDELQDGEVSPYLVHGLSVGDRIEVRGPVGGWFTWDPSLLAPVQLIAGGSGVVPLMAMIRAHADSDSTASFRLLYSARSPESVFYRDELESLAKTQPSFELSYVFTRSAPAGSDGAAGRLDAASLKDKIFPPAADPLVYLCGSTGFVEAVAGWLLSLGYPADTVKTERFGGTGGHS